MIGAKSAGARAAFDVAVQSETDLDEGAKIWVIFISRISDGEIDRADVAEAL